RGQRSRLFGGDQQTIDRYLQHLLPDPAGGAKDPGRITKTAAGHPRADAAVVAPERHLGGAIAAKIHMQQASAMTDVGLDLLQLSRRATPPTTVHRHDLHETDSAGITLGR